MACGAWAAEEEVVASAAVACNDPRKRHAPSSAVVIYSCLDSSTWIQQEQRLMSGMDDVPC